MSYTAKENSRQDGSPVELYDITLGSESWHFCSGEDAFNITPSTQYEPLPTMRDGINVGPEDRKREVAVILPASHEFVRKYIIVIPGTIATITIRRFHRNDDDVETISLFKGIVTAVRFDDNGATASIGVAPFTDRMGLSMPRFVYSSLCNAVLGDQWCTVDLENGSTPDEDSFPYKHIGTASSTQTLSVQIGGITGAGYPDNFFTAGRVVTNAGDTRLVVRQTGNHVRVYVPFFEGTDLDGQSLTIFVGCDHSVTMCHDRFRNVINFQGYPYVPSNNPFQTGLT